MRDQAGGGQSHFRGRENRDSPRAGDAPVARHSALIGTGGNVPWGLFETDAAIYDLADGKLHLAGATTLKVKMGDELREIFWSPQPVNVLVDCQTGKGEIENRGQQPVQVKTGESWSRSKPGRQPATFASAGRALQAGRQTGSDLEPIPVARRRGPAGKQRQAGLPGQTCARGFPPPAAEADQRQHDFHAAMGFRRRIAIVVQHGQPGDHPVAAGTHADWHACG